jgi:general secretion pathway protein G
MRKSKISRRRSRRSGFTLLEVMLVVGLLALLAAFVVPNLFQSAENAKIDLASAAVGRSGPIASQVDQFYFHTNHWPETLQDLVERPSDSDIAEKWRGPYIPDADSLSDPWGNPYGYAGGDEAEHNTGKYDLWSNGPDGVQGTDDDVTSWKKD